MKNPKLLPLFLALPIGLTLVTGCSPQQEAPTQDVGIESQETTPEVVINEDDRLDSKGLAALEEQITVPEAQKFSDNNFLKVSNGQKITVQSYAKTSEGVATSSDTKKYPAEGEFLHTINIAVEESDNSSDFLDVNEDPLNDVSLTIDGVPLSSELRPVDEMTLLISAPENAEIILKAQTDGVSQSIKLDNAERVTKGIADSWYAPSKQTFDNGNINQKVTVGKGSGTLKMTFKGVENTPWTSDLSWADSGKSSWLIVEATEPEWVFNGDAGSSDAVSKVWVTDSKDKKYELDEVSTENLDDVLVFKVPANESVFTVHTENSTDVSSWGEVVGNTKVIKNEFPINLK